MYTSVEKARDFSKLRAAEIAHKKGFSFLSIIDENEKILQKADFGIVFYAIAKKSNISITVRLTTHEQKDSLSVEKTIKNIRQKYGLKNKYFSYKEKSTFTEDRHAFRWMGVQIIGMSEAELLSVKGIPSNVLAGEKTNQYVYVEEGYMIGVDVKNKITTGICTANPKHTMGGVKVGDHEKDVLEKTGPPYTIRPDESSVTKKDLMYTSIHKNIVIQFSTENNLVTMMCAY